MGGITQGYQTLWKCVIRPPRSQYDSTRLGPQHFSTFEGINIKRTDFAIKNQRGLLLQCSHFQPTKRPSSKLPCVIYLHGNSSCRLEGCTLLVFDFSGCGLSQGEYISLGHYQKDDIKAVVQYLRKAQSVSTIGLWGRSMGAISALMYSDQDPSISALILDSPFSSLEQVCQHLVHQHVKFPGLFSIAFKLLSSTIKEKIDVDVKSLRPINKVGKAFIPAFFIHAQDDQLIPSSHSQRLFKQYGSQYKQIKIIQGNHMTQRPQEIQYGIITFLYRWMQVDQMVPMMMQQNEYHEQKIQKKYGIQQLEQIQLQKAILESKKLQQQQLKLSKQKIQKVQKIQKGQNGQDF